MEQFQIETAQNIRINQNVAHLGDRLLAYLVDSIVLIMYIIFGSWVVGNMNVNSADNWTIYLIMGLPLFLYFLLMEIFTNGQTVGKIFMRIRVVRLDGTKPHFSNYFIRWLLRLIDISFSMGGVAVFTILINGKGQRLGDIAAGTTVISEKKRISLSDTLLRELPADYEPQFPQVTVFEDGEMQLIKNLFDKARRNNDHNIIVSLSNRIKEVADINTDLKPIDFVDIVIKDYNFYTQEL